MTDASSYKILVVEDDTDIKELISLQLQLQNYQVRTAATAKEGFELIGENSFDLFIIDRMLPDSGGLEICRRLRSDSKTANSPILMVTAMSEAENIIEGLDAGADDYITKPFDIEVLQARVRAQLRRLAPSSSDSPNMSFGPLSIDEKRCRVLNEGEEVKLTKTELQILISLAKNPGVVYKRRDLIDRIIGNDVHVTNRTIDTHIAGLRRKLGSQASLIETIRGVGYRLQDE